ncbi:N-acetylglucosaminyltransferase [Clostridiaceae bacterium JG1575]|nr:N-acetylglucosaminyltransferase [Clostridiaceae bacterium JG1575]
MNFLKTGLDWLLWLISTLAFIISLYYTFLAIFSLYVRRRKAKEQGERSFAIVIPAHDEEEVVVQGIESVMRSHYPKALFDVYVIADNCTDQTAQKAQEAGAIVHRREDPEHGGKGYALEWFFERLLKMKKQYRSVVILDADNIIHPDFLKNMNRKMNQGYEVVQGYLDSKNPFDSAITGFYSVEFWISNRMLKLSRDNLGISAQLGGTGFAVNSDILRHYGWDATCLTEDLEFTCKLCLNGYRVGWAHDAVIFDEKPLTLKASWHQRKRWMQGFADVFSQYFFPLMKKGIRTGSLAMVDCAIYSIQPILLIIFGINALLSIGGNILSLLQVAQGVMPSLPVLDVTLKGILFAGATGFQILFSPWVLWKDGKLSGKSLLYYVLYPLYLVTWLPVALLGILHKNDKHWSHTIHTRAITIDELNGK